jgi:hypothetical protein
VRVLARRGLVAVSAEDAFSPGSIGSPLREWVPAQPTPSRELFLTGVPASPRTATLMVANPRARAAIAKVEVVGASGTFAPEGLPSLTVPAGSVETLPLSGIFDGKPVALKVSADVPVTATVRSTLGKDIAYATGVRPVRGTTSFALPDGTAALVLASTGGAGSVRVTAYDAKGGAVLDQPVEVAAASSTGVDLPPKARFVRLVATGDGIVAGLTARGTGLAAAGVLPAVRSVRLPVIRPAW